MDQKRLTGSIEKTWNDSIIERLIAYVRIPNKSPQFDPNWERNGHMEAAVKLVAAWCRAQPLPGSRVEVRRLPGRTPLLLVDVPGELPGTVLLYGHLDKQPEFTGWLPGLGPWEPVIRDGRLYGRGAADDGYAVFSSLTAIAALKSSGCGCRAAWCSSRRARNRVAAICRRTSRRSAAPSASPRSSCASTRNAATTSRSGAPPRSAGSSTARCVCAC